MTAGTNPEEPRLSVIGLGYVGLPLASAFAAGGLDVTGFDIDGERIAELRAGRDRTGEVGPQDFRRDNLRFSHDAADLIDREIHIVTVPTPVDAANRPDLGPLHDACRTVGRALKSSRPRNPAPIVVFESTVYPGVTEDVCRPLIETESGRALRPGIFPRLFARTDQSRRPHAAPGQCDQSGGGADRGNRGPAARSLWPHRQGRRLRHPRHQAPPKRRR